MRVVIQRVLEASVSINNKIYNKINKGLLLLVAFTNNDTLEDLEYVSHKIINLRIFNDSNNKLNLSIKDLNYEILSISQFTLYAETKKGNRPSFTRSLNPIEAKKLYEEFNNLLNKEITTKSGIFQEDMKINLINDGPVSIIIDSKMRDF